MKKLLWLPLLVLSITSMAQTTKKTTELPAATSLGVTNEVIVNQSGVTKRAGIQLLPFVDSVWSSNDTVYYRYKGVKTFAYKQSASGGSGTVTNFSVAGGSADKLYSVTNPTTTPALVQKTAPPGTVFGNNNGGAATPDFFDWNTLPIGTNTQGALDNKVDKTTTVNGHALSANVTVSKTDVGLSNVDNTPDATKPVSTAQATAIGLKVDKTTQVNGHDLSADVTVTKSDVGLGNNDNTSDAAKPVSTAQATAIGLKVDKTTTVNGHALSSNVIVSGNDVYPTQTGNSGKALVTDGTNAAWQTVSGGGSSTHVDSIRMGSNYTTVGPMFDQYWTNPSALPSDWTKNGTWTTVFSTTGITVSGGTGVTGSNKFLQWDYVNYDKIKLDLVFVVQTKTATDSGLSFKFGQVPSVIFASSIDVRVDLTNGVDSGKIFFNGVAISKNSSWNVGDTLRFSFARDLWTEQAWLVNFRTKACTVSDKILNSNGIGSGGKLQLGIYGGTQKIIHTGGTSNSNALPKMVFFTTSVGFSGVSSFANSWPGIVAKGNLKRVGFFGGPGATDGDLEVAYLPLAKNLLHTGLNQTVYAALSENTVGVAGNYSDTANYRIRIKAFRDTIHAHATDATIIWVSAMPRIYVTLNPGYDTVTQSVAAGYGDPYVNVSTLMTTNGYSTGFMREGLVCSDGLHPSDSGGAIYAQQILAKTPYTTYQDYYGDTLGYSYFNAGNLPAAQLDAQVMAQNSDGSVGILGTSLDAWYKGVFLSNTYNSSGQGYKAIGNTALFTDKFLGTDGWYISGNPKGLIFDYNTTSNTNSVAVPNRAGDNILMTNGGSNGFPLNLAGWTPHNTIQMNTGGTSLGFPCNNNGTGNILIGPLAGTGGTNITTAHDNVEIKTGTGNNSLTTNLQTINLGNGNIGSGIQDVISLGWPEAGGTMTNANNSMIFGSNLAGIPPAGHILFMTGSYGAQQYDFGGIGSYGANTTFKLPYANPGANSNGWSWTFKASEGDGSGASGIIDFQTTHSIGAGGGTPTNYTSAFTLTQDTVEVKRRLKLSAAETHAYIAKTANYTISSANDFIVNCTANSFTITLPTAVGMAGTHFIVINSGGGVITLATTSSQTINGTTPTTVSTTTNFVSDGANWRSW